MYSFTKQMKVILGLYSDFEETPQKLVIRIIITPRKRSLQNWERFSYNFNLLELINF